MKTFPARFDAIKVTQSLGEFFVVAVPADFLRRVVYLDPTRIASVDRPSFLYSLLGSQRKASLTRAQEIAKFINTVEAAFPNSIILAANYIHDGEFQVDEEVRWRIECNDGRYELVVPSDRTMASVIDGQHRLLGFDYCKDDKRSMELLCAVYMDLPQAYQAFMFATINFNQRKVNRSLAYEQFGYNLDEESRAGWAPDKLAVYFTRKLNLDPNSPLHYHIKVTPLEADLIFPQSEDGRWMLSTACIVEGIMSLFASKPNVDRDLLHSHSPKDRKRTQLIDDSSPLRTLYLNGKDEEIRQLLLQFLAAVKNHLWEKAKAASFIRKTIGVQALFDVFRTVGQRVSLDELPAEINRVLEMASKVDYSNEFFQASGKGRVRVKNTILRIAGIIKDADLPDLDRQSYLDLMASAAMQ